MDDQLILPFPNSALPDERRGWFYMVTCNLDGMKTGIDTASRSIRQAVRRGRKRYATQWPNKTRYRWKGFHVPDVEEFEDRWLHATREFRPKKQCEVYEMSVVRNNIRKFDAAVINEFGECDIYANKLLDYVEMLCEGGPYLPDGWRISVDSDLSKTPLCPVADNLFSVPLDSYSVWDRNGQCYRFSEWDSGYDEQFDEKFGAVIRQRDTESTNKIYGLVKRQFRRTVRGSVENESGQPVKIWDFTPVKCLCG